NSDIYCLKQSLNGQRETLKTNTFLLKSNLFDISQRKENKLIQPEISVITSTNRKENLDIYIDQMNKQKNVNLEINLVTHGFELSSEEIEEYENRCVYPINILYMNEENSLGEIGRAHV